MIQGESKASLRKKIRMLIGSFSAEYKTNSDSAIMENLLSMEEYQNAKNIFCFVGTASEINTLPIIKQALYDGKQVSVPLCLASGLMEARLIKGLEDLSPGAYGILEPSPYCPVLPKSAIDLALIPCLTCNRQGIRLGKGGGYYDRYLDGCDFTKAVLCREALICDFIPSDSWDIPANIIITDRSIYRNNRR